MEGVGEIHKSRDLWGELAILCQGELRVEMAEVGAEEHGDLYGLCGGVDKGCAGTYGDIVGAQQFEAADGTFLSCRDEQAVFVYGCIFFAGRPGKGGEEDYECYQYGSHFFCFYGLAYLQGIFWVRLGFLSRSPGGMRKI